MLPVSHYCLPNRTHPSILSSILLFASDGTLEGCISTCSQGHSISSNYIELNTSSLLDCRLPSTISSTLWISINCILPTYSTVSSQICSKIISSWHLIAHFKPGQLCSSQWTLKLSQLLSLEYSQPASQYTQRYILEYTMNFTQLYTSCKPDCKLSITSRCTWLLTPSLLDCTVPSILPSTSKCPLLHSVSLLHWMVYTSKYACKSKNTQYFTWAWAVQYNCKCSIPRLAVFHMLITRWLI